MGESRIFVILFFNLGITVYRSWCSGRFSLFKEEKTWMEAEEYCRKEKATLAAWKTEEDIEDLKNDLDIPITRSTWTNGIFKDDGWFWTSENQRQQLFVDTGCYFQIRFNRIKSGNPQHINVNGCFVFCSGNGNLAGFWLTYKMCSCILEGEDGWLKKIEGKCTHRCLDPPSFSCVGVLFFGGYFKLNAEMRAVQMNRETFVNGHDCIYLTNDNGRITLNAADCRRRMSVKCVSGAKVKESSTWDEAARYCNNQNTDLPFKLNANVLAGKQYWSGIRRKANWIWNEEPETYVNQKLNFESELKTSNCVGLKLSENGIPSLWAQPCTDRRAFVCDKKPASMVTTEVLTTSTSVRVSTAESTTTDLPETMQSASLPDTTHSTGLHDTTPSTGLHDTTPSTVLHDTTPSTGFHNTTPSTGLHDTTPSAVLHDTTQNSGLPDTTPSADLPDTTPSIASHNTTLRTGLPDTAPSAGLPYTTQTIGLPDITQSTGLHVMTQSTGLPDTTQIARLPDTTQRAGLHDSTQSAGSPDTTQRTGLHDTTQNTGSPDTTQSAVLPVSTQSSSTEVEDSTSATTSGMLIRNSSAPTSSLVPSVPSTSYSTSTSTSEFPPREFTGPVSSVIHSSDVDSTSALTLPSTVPMSNEMHSTSPNLAAASTQGTNLLISSTVPVTNETYSVSARDDALQESSMAGITVIYSRLRVGVAAMWQPDVSSMLNTTAAEDCMLFEESADVLYCTSGTSLQFKTVKVGDGILVGCAVGGILVIVILILAAIFIYKRYAQSRSLQPGDKQRQFNADIYHDILNIPEHDYFTQDTNAEIHIGNEKKGHGSYKKNVVVKSNGSGAAGNKLSSHNRADNDLYGTEFIEMSVNSSEELFRRALKKINPANSFARSVHFNTKEGNSVHALLYERERLPLPETNQPITKKLVLSENEYHTIQDGTVLELTDEDLNCAMNPGNQNTKFDDHSDQQSDDYDEVGDNSYCHTVIDEDPCDEQDIDTSQNSETPLYSQVMKKTEPNITRNLYNVTAINSDDNDNDYGYEYIHYPEAKEVTDDDLKNKLGRRNSNTFDCDCDTLGVKKSNGDDVANGNVYCLTFIDNDIYEKQDIDTFQNLDTTLYSQVRKVREKTEPNNSEHGFNFTPTNEDDTNACGYKTVQHSVELKVTGDDSKSKLRQSNSNSCGYTNDKLRVNKFNEDDGDRGNRYCHAPIDNDLYEQHDIDASRNSDTPYKKVVVLEHTSPYHSENVYNFMPTNAENVRVCHAILDSSGHELNDDDSKIKLGQSSSSTHNCDYDTLGAKDCNGDGVASGSIYGNTRSENDPYEEQHIDMSSKSDGSQCRQVTRKTPLNYPRTVYIFNPNDESDSEYDV